MECPLILQDLCFQPFYRFLRVQNACFKKADRSVNIIVCNWSDVHIRRYIGHFASAVFDNKPQPFHIGVLIAVNDGPGFGRIKIKLVDGEIPPPVCFLYAS